MQKGFFDPITVMNIDIDVEDSWVHLQELQDADYNIVDVAKARGTVTFCVVQTSSPIDGYVSVVVDDEVRTINGSPSGQLTEGEDTWKKWTIDMVANVVWVW